MNKTYMFDFCLNFSYINIYYNNIYIFDTRNISPYLYTPVTLFEPLSYRYRVLFSLFIIVSLFQQRPSLCYPAQLCHEIQERYVKPVDCCHGELSTKGVRREKIAETLR